MADIKRDQERDELFRSIYKIATDLVHAGHVSEWDFKSYVLGTMFYRYISENFASYINAGEHAAGNAEFDYAKMPDAEAESAREGLVQEKGFFILPSELFCNVLACADKDENLNETLERVFNHIESSAASGDAENDFAGLFDDFDVNSKSIGETVAKRNKVLAELLHGVDRMPLFSTDGINPDLFGDAYEYLMGMYAANAGKKGGQYFTPADVSELLARLGTIGKTRINKVYDPACGSGSLLLKVEKVLGKENIERGFFGQEIDLTTYNLCRINMFLHNIDFDKFSIVREDTLISPQHWDDQPFELIVSNPPFSVPWDGDKNPLLINDERFSPAGVLAPASKGDTSLQITFSHDLIICTDKTKAILSEKLLAHHFEHCWIGYVSDVLKGQAVAQIKGDKSSMVDSFPPGAFKGDHMLRHRLGQGLLERFHQLMAFVYILNVGSVSLHPRHGEKTFFYKLMEVIFAGESFFEALPIPCKKAT